MRWLSVSEVAARRVAESAISSIEARFCRATRVMFSAASEALPDVLKAVERRKPYVFLDNLAITAGATSSPGLPAAAPLAIRCDFYAYAPEAPS